MKNGSFRNHSLKHPTSGYCDWLNEDPHTDLPRMMGVMGEDGGNEGRGRLDVRGWYGRWW